MGAYAILDASGVWQNTIEWDGVTPFPPPAGSTVQALSALPSGGAAGATLANGVWTPAPTPPQTLGLTFLQFMALFKPAEQDAIVNSTDTQVRLFNLMAAGAGSIDLTNPEVTGGVAYLASLGLVASGRVATILAGSPPT